MEIETNLTDTILAAWKTSNRVSIFMLENLPQEVWSEKVPGYQRKTVQMVGGHMHNTRCMWIKEATKKFDLHVPEYVDRYSVTTTELIEALHISSAEIMQLIKKGIETGSTVPGFYLDAVHLQYYLVAHEAHHRGQIVMVTRQLGYELPEKVTYGLWHWSKRAKEL
ncbi:hypothetical protein NC796_12850 [Aliifodinibius sp. S!AR15-10]|uniref:DinB family protein n=1 Tax=Aliifodinibius sp. S!AR15-10 TaxID=2950437 RepID=UPI0028547424|nr:DinB family protein [Aliifodinibius sp. S!AR15-10]MDR8392038.1 hypothetical protein [Aliifodinibius sp. S!AR15-10]